MDRAVPSASRFGGKVPSILQPEIAAIVATSIQKGSEPDFGKYRAGSSGKRNPTIIGAERRDESYAADTSVRATGLHLADVERLLESLNRLADAGHTVLLIDRAIHLGREGAMPAGKWW